MESSAKLLTYGIDTLVLNVRYTDKNLQPVKRELDEVLALRLDQLQYEARHAEVAVASDWLFKDTVLFVEPTGAGRQWRWRLTCRYLTLTVSPGRFNDLIAQVRLASEYLWQEAWAGDALSQVHDLLMSIFGEYILPQASEVHLCADLMGYDFSQVDYEQHFVTRVRKNSSIYALGVEGVSLDNHRVSTLQFSSHASPLSCSIYNKTLEIKQKSHKTFFYDLWCVGLPAPSGGQWDGESDVWRVEFRFKRDFLHQLTSPIEGAYVLLDQLSALWTYAAGSLAGGSDGLPDGWLRYVLPSEDSNRSRWPVHPAWEVVQAAFLEPGPDHPGAVVRYRVREKNLERGVAATVGYLSTLAAWLGGEYVAPESDLSMVLQWLYSSGSDYLDVKQRDFIEEVKKKQLRYAPRSYSYLVNPLNDIV